MPIIPLACRRGASICRIGASGCGSRPVRRSSANSRRPADMADGRPDHRLERDALGVRLAGELVQQRAPLPRELLHRQRDDQQRAVAPPRRQAATHSGASGAWHTGSPCSSPPLSWLRRRVGRRRHDVEGHGHRRVSQVKGDPDRPRPGRCCCRGRPRSLPPIWTAFVSIRSRSRPPVFQLCRGRSRVERAAASCALSAMV